MEKFAGKSWKITMSIMLNWTLYIHFVNPYTSPLNTLLKIFKIYLSFSTYLFQRNINVRHYIKYLALGPLLPSCAIALAPDWINESRCNQTRSSQYIFLRAKFVLQLGIALIYNMNLSIYHILSIKKIKVWTEIGSPSFTECIK